MFLFGSKLGNLYDVRKLDPSMLGLIFGYSDPHCSHLFLPGPVSEQVLGVQYPDVDCVTIDQFSESVTKSLLHVVLYFF